VPTGPTVRSIALLAHVVASGCRGRASADADLARIPPSTTLAASCRGQSFGLASCKTAECAHPPLPGVYSSTSLHRALALGLPVPPPRQRPFIASSVGPIATPETGCLLRVAGPSNAHPTVLAARRAARSVHLDPLYIEVMARCRTAALRPADDNRLTISDEWPGMRRWRPPANTV